VAGWTYYANEHLPSWAWTILERDGLTVAQLAAEGWTPSVEVIRDGTPAKLVATQTTNLQVANSSPNLIRLQWSSATLALIVADMAAEPVVEYIEHPVLTLAGAREGIRTGDPVRHVFKAVPS